MSFVFYSKIYDKNSIALNFTFDRIICLVNKVPKCTKFIEENSFFYQYFLQKGQLPIFTN